jgi:hypothetical protein
MWTLGDKPGTRFGTRDKHRKSSIQRSQLVAKGFQSTPTAQRWVGSWQVEGSPFYHIQRHVHKETGHSANGSVGRIWGDFYSLNYLII